MSNRLLRNLRDVNPIPNPDRLLIDKIEARAFLATVQDRRHGMTERTQPEVQQTGTQPRSAEPRRDGEAVISVVQTPRRRFAYGLAAVVVALIVGIATLFATTIIGGNNDLTEAGALSVTDEFFAEMEAGDYEGVLALFEPTATFGMTYVPSTRLDFEQWLAYVLATDATLTASQCTTTRIDTATENATIQVQCAVANQTFPGSGAPPAEQVYTLDVSPNGISRFSESRVDYLFVRTPFLTWLRENHPGAALEISFGSWGSVEEARQIGAKEAQYAEEWVNYLQANGCAYDDRNC